MAGLIGKDNNYVSHGRALKVSKNSMLAPPQWCRYKVAQVYVLGVTMYSLKLIVPRVRHCSYHLENREKYILCWPPKNKSLLLIE